MGPRGGTRYQEPDVSNQGSGMRSGRGRPPYPLPTPIMHVLGGKGKGEKLGGKWARPCALERRSAWSLWQSFVNSHAWISRYFEQDPHSNQVECHETGKARQSGCGASHDHGLRDAEGTAIRARRHGAIDAL